mmetsp:Transcript_58302/g.131115  ORF Transcript_58302/g.131115 Transcript_58302/m.131115 type:complete len:210 (+) Transcript_58302:315-944(+)
MEGRGACAGHESSQRHDVGHLPDPAQHHRGRLERSGAVGDGHAQVAGGALLDEDCLYDRSDDLFHRHRSDRRGLHAGDVGAHDSGYEDVRLRAEDVLWPVPRPPPFHEIFQAVHGDCHAAVLHDLGGPHVPGVRRCLGLQPRVRRAGRRRKLFELPECLEQVSGDRMRRGPSLETEDTGVAPCPRVFRHPDPLCHRWRRPFLRPQNDAL